MPVNEKKGIEELLEHGWGQMRGMLDKEMPQPNRQLVGLWLPIGILSIALLIVSVIYLTGNMISESPEEKVANPHQSFAETEATMPPGAHVDKIDKSALTSEFKEDNSASESDLTAVTPTDISTESGVNDKTTAIQKSTIETSDGVNPAAAAAADVPNSKIEVVSTGRDQTLTVAPAIGSTKQLQSSTASIKQLQSSGGEHKMQEPLPTVKYNNEKDKYVSGLNSEQRSVESISSESGVNSDNELYQRELQPIEVLASDNIALFKYAPTVQPVIPVISNAKPRVGLDALFATHYTAPVQLQGYELGALATISLGRKWKILAGASFGHYNNNGLIMNGGRSQSVSADLLNVPITLDTTNINYPFNDPEVDYNNISYDTARLLSEQFNYLHFPLLGHFRINKFLSVTCGVKVSYLLSAPSSPNLSATVFPGSQFSALDLKTSRNFLEEENILASWDVAPIIGIALDIGGRFAFDVQYQHGLIPYVNRPTDGDRTDYHRSVSLGLRYSIF